MMRLASAGVEMQLDIYPLKMQPTPSLEPTLTGTALAA